MRAALLTFATAILLWGCGGDDDSSTPADTTTSTGTAAGPPPAGSAKSDETPSTAEVEEALAGFRACLERQGAPAGSLPVPNGEYPDEDLQRKLAKMGRAAAGCLEKLPKDVELGDASEPDLAKLHGEAEAAFQRAEEFRACMGRHGFGPEAGTTKPTGDLSQAFSDCRGEAAAGQ